MREMESKMTYPEFLSISTEEEGDLGILPRVAAFQVAQEEVRESGRKGLLAGHVRQGVVRAQPRRNRGPGFNSQSRLTSAAWRSRECDAPARSDPAA